MSATQSKPASARTTVLVVLGMHRSGTSALMGAFHKLGLDLGSQLLPEQDDNRTGFWENQALVSFNQSIHASLNRTWHDVSPLPDSWWKTREISAKLPELVTLLKNEFGDSKTWGMKDPRTCRLLPIWQKGFKKAGLEPVYCLTLRHPLEVAASLKKRDGFGQEKGLLLWLDHVLTADWHTRKCARLWIHFPDLLQNPKDVVEGISKSLHLPWTQLSQSQQGILKDFLNPSLRNHKAVTNQASVSQLAETCIDLYEKLKDCPEEDGTRKAMQKAWREWRKATGFFAGWIDDQKQSFELAQAEIQAARNSHLARDQMDSSRLALIEKQRLELETLSTQLASSQKEVAQQATELEAREQEIVAAKNHVDKLVKEIQVAKSIHDDQCSQLQTAREAHAQKDHQLDQARQNIAILQSQVETAARIHDEKELQIDSARKNMALLEQQVTIARDAIANKDQQIEQAREGFTFLQDQIHHAREIQDTLAKELEETKATVARQTQELAQARDRANLAREEIDQARQNIDSLCREIEIAREAHRAKDRQIEEARSHLNALLKDLTIAKEGHDVKDRQLDEARQNMASLQEQIEIARQGHLSKDEQLEHSRQLLEQLQSELERERRQRAALQKDFGTQFAEAQLKGESQEREAVQALAEARSIMASQAKEIEVARQVHDQKMAEIERASQVHDQMALRLEEARDNMKVLAEQIEQARQAHAARDQIEAELRRQIFELQKTPKASKRSGSDTTLRPQTES